jgi:ribosomal protein S18 acetylase RimI-like enzyme
VTVAPLGTGDEAAVVAYVTAAQADPTRHVTYVGDQPATVLADLRAATAWRERTLVAHGGDDRPTGVLTVDVDEDLGRLWWLGPWADDVATARELLTAAGSIAALVHEREFAPDARNTDLARLATDLGYRPEEPSAVLVRDLATWPDDDPAGPGGVRVLEPEDRDEVARLHDHLFAGTHTRGRDLVRDGATEVLVAGDDPRGYVATQEQADGTLYIDFLGVDPAARGRGLGRTLIAAAVTRAAGAGAPAASLTVRAGNRHARALYASLGFTQERMIAPYRRGFTRDTRP